MLRDVSRKSNSMSSSSNPSDGSLAPQPHQTTHSCYQRAIFYRLVPLCHVILTFLCATCLLDDDSIEKRMRWDSGESDVKIVFYSLFSSPVLRRRCTFEAWRSIEKAVALGRKINFKRGARGSRNSTTNPRTRPHLPSTLLYSPTSF